MTKPRAATTLCALALSALAISPASAVAEERTCRGTIGATTLDNVRVPQNATCVLQGTYVKGTVKVETNAALRAEGVRVIGNVQGENARHVAVLQGSRVGGSVQVVQGGGANVAGSRITGDILYDDNDGRVRAVQNRVGGSVQAFQNTGGVEIRGNVINGNLQCKENNPPPFGGANTVGGNKEDQCAGL
jgi:hypothetical protein